MAKKITAKKPELQTRTFYTDVTEAFDPVKDDIDFTLNDLKQIVEDMIVAHGADADISTEIEGDDYYSSWTWTVTNSRLETESEQKERLKKEKERLKREKQYEAQEERRLRKEYLHLKKKFEGK